MCRYRKVESNFQSAIMEIVYNETPASAAKEAFTKRRREKKGKEALKYWMLTKNCYRIG